MRSNRTVSKLRPWKELSLVAKLDRLIWLHGSLFHGAGRLYRRTYKAFLRELPPTP